MITTHLMLISPAVSTKRLALVVTASLLLNGCADAIPTSPAAPARASLTSVHAIVAEDLGTLPGGDYSYFNDINEAGDAVGDASTATGAHHGIRWTQAGGMVDLGALPGDDISGAWSINDAGDIVGQSVGDFARRAVLWPADGGEIVDLGNFGGNNTVAWAINNLGQVVGESTTSPDDLADFETHAFVWTRTTGMVDLNSARAGATLSVAYGINDLGQIVGRIAGPGFCDAVIWQPDGSLTTLGSLGGSCSIAFGINDRGEVVGFSQLSSGVAHEFMWQRNVGMTDLGTVGLTTSAFDISKSGDVVGYGYDLEGREQATLWDKQNGLTILSTVGGCCAAASAINENGEIVGYSHTSKGSYHATRWTTLKHQKKATP